MLVYDAMYNHFAWTLETIEIKRTKTSMAVRNRMPVSLRGGGGKLGNLKP
jgi:hypothetical protein